jgi:hypothetical protein
MVRGAGAGVLLGRGDRVARGDGVALERALGRADAERPREGEALALAEGVGEWLGLSWAVLLAGPGETMRGENDASLRVKSAHTSARQTTTRTVSRTHVYRLGIARHLPQERPRAHAGLPSPSALTAPADASERYGGP